MRLMLVSCSAGGTFYSLLWLFTESFTRVIELITGQFIHPCHLKLRSVKPAGLRKGQIFQPVWRRQTAVSNLGRGHQEAKAGALKIQRVAESFSNYRVMLRDIRTCFSYVESSVTGITASLSAMAAPKFHAWLNLRVHACFVHFTSFSDNFKTHAFRQTSKRLFSCASG